MVEMTGEWEKQDITHPWFLWGQWAQALTKTLCSLPLISYFCGCAAGGCTLRVPWYQKEEW
jgi:hypothetical protein